LAARGRVRRTRYWILNIGHRTSAKGYHSHADGIIYRDTTLSGALAIPR